ncbi:MAG: polysaccharide biosynthesis tyrosine autokinase [Methylococcaceae bacterium]|nr:polysaccharide biosynthesis tyrosine autokinase [Methylococcaceae bacterium]
MSIIEKALQKTAVFKQNAENNVNNVQHTVTENIAPLVTPAIEDVIKVVAPKLTAQNIKTTNTIQINWAKLIAAGFISPEQTNSQLSEEYRIIKRPLVSNALNGKSKGIARANLILVTSSLPGEGKTFSAINLAISIANERDKQVLLIDADVAKPSVSKLFDIKNGPGLIEYLEGGVNDLSEIILQTDIEGLRVIPAGKRHGYSTELLASNKMQELSMELSERYNDRIVIFDSPPLLAATQGEVLASMVGQVVLVIEADQTQQNDVMESIRKLKNCDVVLALLNKTRNNFNLNYYGYGNYGN